MMIVERKSKKHVKEFQFTSSAKNAGAQIAGERAGSARARLLGKLDRANAEK